MYFKIVCAVLDNFRNSFFDYIIEQKRVVEILIVIKLYFY